MQPIAPTSGRERSRGARRSHPVARHGLGIARRGLGIARPGHAVRRFAGLAAAASALAVAAAACGNSAATPVPAGPTPTLWTPPALPATPAPTTTTGPAPTSFGIAFPIALVARYDDPRAGMSGAALKEAAASGGVLVPCELISLALDGVPMSFYGATTCLPATDITAAAMARSGTLALLPPGLVAPQVKVLPIGEADLFGSPTHRANAYPLVAWTANPAPWTAYDAGNVRTLISTGDTCPDRGISHQAVFAGKGWDWVLSGGTVHYRKFTWSDHLALVPSTVRTGNEGALAALISDNDIGVNDFECPMLTKWKQHDTGMHFNIDPAVAKLLATKGGVKTVTIGSNHMTDGGVAGIRQTIEYLDAAGIAHTGAGLTEAQALAPAVVDVRGVKFAFVGWDEGSGGEIATPTHPGVAQLSRSNVCSSIKAARAVGDIVIAQPQWGFPEYHNDMTARQVAQRKWMYDCGADGILGSGTHWASWASITPGPNGPRFALGSHGNFLFNQYWSRQTMEGVIAEATYVGTTLVQFRLHPYVIIDNAQPNLTDPTTDGKYVLNQVWSVGEVR